MDYQNSLHLGKNNAVRNTMNTQCRENGVTISTAVLTSMPSATSGRTTLISRLAALALFWALCWAFHSRCFWRRMDSSSAVSVPLFSFLPALYLAYSAVLSPLSRPPAPLRIDDAAAGTFVISSMSAGQQSMLKDGHLGSHSFPKEDVYHAVLRMIHTAYSGNNNDITK